MKETEEKRCLRGEGVGTKEGHFMNYTINPTDPPLKDGIYYFTKRDRQVTPIRCTFFTDEELFQIDAAVQIMERLFKNLERSTGVKEAYDEFIAETKKPKGGRPYETEAVDRRFRAFIFEWKMYTEHWKNYIFDLGESVFPDEFIVGFQELYKNLMNSAFKDSAFVIPHVLRNYVSHANDAINNSHVDGKDNKFRIYRQTLEKFLQISIGKTHGKKKTELEEQLRIIEAQSDLIDLTVVAENSMAWLRQCETALMNYQIEPKLLQACNILGQAKQKIDESGIQSEVWEIWRLIPFYLDHTVLHSLTLRATIDGQHMEYTYFTNRLNWIGYAAVIAYVRGLVEKAMNIELERSSNGKDTE